MEAKDNILVANEMETRGEILWRKDMENTEKLFEPKNQITTSTPSS
jgi:hypothetical protein